MKGPSELHLKYARWQEHVGNLDEAEESYEFVLAEDAKSVDAVLGLARIHQLRDRTHEAEQGFRKALKMAPENPHVLDTVGQFYASEERWSEAVDLLQKAVQTAPGEKIARYHLAVALARTGRRDEAMPHFRKSVGDAEAHYNLGLVLHEEGQLAQAEEQFLQAVLKKPNLKQAQYWLDETRRQQEVGTMLADRNDSAGRFEELPPPQGSSGSANRGSHVSVSNRARRSSAPGSSRSGVRAAGHSFPAGRRGTARNAQLSQPQAPRPSREAVDSRAPSDMTARQREQWYNQLERR